MGVVHFNILSVLQVLSADIHFTIHNLIFGETCDVRIGEALEGAAEFLGGSLDTLLIHSSSIRSDLDILLHLPLGDSLWPLGKAIHTLFRDVVDSDFSVELLDPSMQIDRLQISISLSLIHI